MKNNGTKNAFFNLDNIQVQMLQSKLTNNYEIDNGTTYSVQNKIKHELRTL